MATVRSIVSMVVVAVLRFATHAGFFASLGVAAVLVVVYLVGSPAATTGRGDADPARITRGG